jgi:integrase
MPLKLVRRHGSPNWYLRGSIRGVAVDESTGVADRRAAETIRSKREWEIIEASIHGRKATTTFLEAAIDYIEDGGERRYLKPLIDFFGTTPLAKIDQAAIDRAADFLKPKAENSTRDRQIYSPISAVLKRAAKRNLCDWRQIERPSQPKGRVRWIAPAEADQLIRACSPHLRPLVIFLFYTGARVSEAIYLEWQQVDLARRQVQFLAAKNGEPRGVPLHPRVIQALERLSHRDGAVFRRSDGRPYERKADGGGQIKTGFKGACKRAGVVNFHPHDCRHTWATWHYAANRDLVALMELGGWKSERMVLRYAHMNVAHREHSVAALPWEKSGESEKVTVQFPDATSG